jgi:hypothetical protein
VKWPVLDS